MRWALLAASLAAAFGYSAVYSHSDFGTSLVIYPIAKAKCASYFVKPIMAISPLRVSVDGSEILPHVVEVWHPDATTSAQEVDTILVFGNLRSLSFYKEIKNGESKFMAYEVPDSAKVISITYQPRYPDDTLGEAVTVVVDKGGGQKGKNNHDDS